MDAVVDRRRTDPAAHPRRRAPTPDARQGAHGRRVDRLAALAAAQCARAGAVRCALEGGRSRGSVRPVRRDPRDRRACAGRSPLRRAGVERASVLRADEAELPDRQPLPHRSRDAGAAAGARQAAARVRHPPVRRRDRAVELSGDESGGAEARRRDRWREPRARHVEPRRGCAHRPHLDERRARLRGRPQSGGHARRRRVPQRADRADPVRADDAEGASAPAVDRSAVHQQVLHPRPAAGRLVRPLGRRPRATRCS